MKETHERRPNRHCSRPYFSKREGRSAFKIVEPRFAVVAEMVSREVCAATGTAKVVDWGVSRLFDVVAGRCGAHGKPG